MKRLSWKEGAFIFNMTMFLVTMNLAAGIITQTGTFTVQRVDLTEAECVTMGGSWQEAKIDPNISSGFCTLSKLINIEYEDDLAKVIQQQVCANPEENMSLPCGEEGNIKTYQDEGVANSIIDTTLKTLGDVSAGLTTTARLFSTAIISPFSWITTAMTSQCTLDPDDDSFRFCTDRERAQKAQWDSIISYMRIPVYLMYGIFFVQIIMNRSFRGIS